MWPLFTYSAGLWLFQSTGRSILWSCSRRQIMNRKLRGRPAVTKLVKTQDKIDRQVLIIVGENYDLTEEGVLIANNATKNKVGMLRQFHAVDAAKRYFSSEAFKETYQGLHPSLWYVRNHRGQACTVATTRLRCLDDNGIYTTNNPCPICRDEYFWFDYRNTELLKLYLKENSLAPLNRNVSFLCGEQELLLRKQVQLAINRGYLNVYIPHRRYDYREYYGWWDKEPPANPPTELSPTFFALKPEKRVIFPVHKKDVGQDWDPWWLRWKNYDRIVS